VVREECLSHSHDNHRYFLGDYILPDSLSAIRKVSCISQQYYLKIRRINFADCRLYAGLLGVSVVGVKKGAVFEFL